MHATLTVTLRQPGEYDILNNEQLLAGSVPKVNLPAYLIRYMAQEQVDKVMHDLEQASTTSIDVLSFGKLQQD
jgi:hypothetical protein